LSDGTTQHHAPGRGAIFEPDPRSSAIYRLFRGTVAFILRLWFRPIIEGPGSVPEEGAAIIAPVHRSNLDFAFAILLTDRKLFFMAKDNLWRWRWFGRFLLAMGAFPVHRESADRSALSHAESVLQSGQVLVMFPEGARKEGPLIGELHEGAAFLSARTDAPILPVGIAGSSKAMPKGAKIPRPRKIRLFMGEALTPGARSELGRVPRSAVHDSTIKLRSRLQDAFERASA
jgi:1-acyl-sn-glycerol-3-phosphate acyltransferase